MAPKSGFTRREVRRVKNRLSEGLVEGLSPDSEPDFREPCFRRSNVRQN